MKKFFKNLWEAISYPFIAFSVLRDEERRANFEDMEAKKIEKERKRETHKR